MGFKIDSMVCIHLPRWKQIAFFCGQCAGTGFSGTGTCFKCNGSGIRTERLQYLVFGGVAKITGLFSIQGQTTYTIVYPFLQGLLDHSKQDTQQIMDVSSAFWEKNKDSQQKSPPGTVTMQIPESQVFHTYNEAIQNLTKCNKEVIDEGIRRHGGVPGIFEENPEKIKPNTTSRTGGTPYSGKPYGEPRVNDLLWAVEYHGNVQKFFRCPQCKGEAKKANVKCSRCHDSGHIAMHIPQYILRGQVRVIGTMSGDYLDLEAAPIPYVDDDTHALITKNYWVNHAEGTDNRIPKNTIATWEHLFYTVDGAKEWLAKKNETMLRQWCEDHHDILPVGMDGEVLEGFKPKVGPKPVPIEACLC